MTSRSSLFAGVMTLAAALAGALPVAKAIDAVTRDPGGVIDVNRSAKGDLLNVPGGAVNKTPVQTIRIPLRLPVQTDRRPIMDGCEPAFSPVTVPSMAHVAGRCVG